MIPLFSSQGLAHFAEIVRPGLLCAFDFDGTLAPIVSEPGAARLPRELLPYLDEISRHAPVAIITGRALSDIQARIGFAADGLIGNHGMEGLPGWEQRAQSYRALCEQWRTQLRQCFRQPALADPGIQIESKQVSLSVHYRLARDPSQAQALLAGVLAGLRPAPRLVAGKYVFNLVPADAPHKGDALEHLIAAWGARSALYVGDDVTDEDVFALRRPDLLTIRVGQGTDSAAQTCLPGQQDIGQLLERIAERLRETGATNWLRAGTTCSR